MRKFIVRTLLFLAIMFVTDRIAGAVLGYIASHPRGGQTLKRNYLTDFTHEDVLVFGSSRAHYHYNPRVVTDSLGLSCFNCGEDSNGIILFYSWWEMISRRYHPQLLIYDVYPQYDVVANGNYEFLFRLKRFYDRPGISAVFDDVEPRERWKMMSMMYRYNSSFTELAADFTLPLVAGTKDGFVALEGTVPPERSTGRIRYADMGVQIDTLRLTYIEKLIDDLGPTRIIFVASPIYDGMNPKIFEPVEAISKKYGIPFLDYTNDPKYVRHVEYFKDLNHLNNIGADLFTQDLMRDLHQKYGITKGKIAAAETKDKERETEKTK